MVSLADAVDMAKGEEVDDEQITALKSTGRQVGIVIELAQYGYFPCIHRA